eukprot:5653459-Pyramimonas_sp.AAC.2
MITPTFPLYIAFGTIRLDVTYITMGVCECFVDTVYHFVPYVIRCYSQPRVVTLSDSDRTNGPFVKEMLEEIQGYLIDQKMKNVFKVRNPAVDLPTD